MALSLGLTFLAHRVTIVAVVAALRRVIVSVDDCHASTIFLPRAQRYARRPSSFASKQLDESSWFLTWRLPSTYPTPCVFLRNLGISKIRVPFSRNYPKF